MSSEKRKRTFSEAARAVFVSLFLTWRQSCPNAKEVFDAAGLREGHVAQCVDGSIDDGIVVRLVKYNDGQYRVEVQQWIYERSKAQLLEVEDLDNETRSSDFSQFIAAVGKMAQETCGQARSPIANFALKYLGKEDFRPLRGWLNGETVALGTNIDLLLRKLKAWREGTLTPIEVAEPAEPEEPEKTEGFAACGALVQTPIPQLPPATISSGGRRKLVEFIVTMLNASLGVVVENDIVPADVYDSERMQFRSTVRKVCERFGIEVQFAEPNIRLEPVTRKDMAELGLKTTSKKRR